MPLQARQRYHMVFKWILCIRGNIFFYKSGFVWTQFPSTADPKMCSFIESLDVCKLHGLPEGNQHRMTVAVRLTHFTHTAEGSLAAVMELRSPSVCVKSRLCFSKSHFIPRPRRHFLIISFYYSALSKLILNQAHSLFQTPPERFECTCWLAATQLASLWM